MKNSLKALPLLALAGAASAGLNACNGDPYPCVKEEIAGPSATSSPGDGIGQVQQGLYVKSNAIWDRDDHKIPVCWESDTWAIQKDSDRAIVKKAIDETWNQVLAFELVPEKKQFQFVGFEECNSSNDDGIRISVPYGNEKNPHTSALGDSLAGRDAGMVLNFDYTKWSTACSSSEGARQYCIYVIAVHEFGHALGFAHEQNRPDTDRDLCTDAPQGTSGDILMGPWDADSVMNYCNVDWNNGGQLSDGDILGVRAAYYPELYDFQCVGEFKQRNPVLKNSPRPSPSPSAAPSQAPSGRPCTGLLCL